MSRGAVGTNELIVGKIGRERMREEAMDKYDRGWETTSSLVVCLYSV